MEKSQNIPPVRYVLIVIYLLTIGMNYISQAIPFNGKTNGEVSAEYSTLITPADYAFAIWGVIYFALGMYVLYQAVWASSEKAVYDRIAQWLIAGLVATSAWLPAFQYEFIGLTVIIMLLILFTLIKIATELVRDNSMSAKEKFWVEVPIGLYLGWISVATIVNIAILWKYGGLPFLGLSELAWLVIILTVVFFLAIGVNFLSRNGIYALVFMWAYLAIASKEEQQQDIQLYILGMAAVLFIVGILTLFRRYKLIAD